jgi:hypothetical protein
MSKACIPAWPVMPSTGVGMCNLQEAGLEKGERRVQKAWVQQSPAHHLPPWPPAPNQALTPTSGLSSHFQQLQS